MSRLKWKYLAIQEEKRKKKEKERVRKEGNYTLHPTNEEKLGKNPQGIDIFQIV